MEARQQSISPVELFVQTPLFDMGVEVDIWDAVPPNRCS